MQIKCGDGTLLGDLHAAAQLAELDNKPNARDLYNRAAARIAQLESVLHDYACPTDCSRKECAEKIEWCGWAARRVLQDPKTW